ncbi:NfeD family protein [Thiohalocapsa marina]|uniref:NfeD family protein n=1 Tax=Thiohalocapsa marina TaxID=424902 RepID=UPI0036DEF584
MATLLANPWLWLSVGAVLMALELLLPGLYLLWAGLGAVVVGLLLALFPDLPVPAQLLLFALTMLSMIGAGVLLQRRETARRQPLNRELQALIGQELIATTVFEAGRGRVRVADTTYAALCDAPVQPGQHVRVTAIEGGRLRVDVMGPVQTLAGSDRSSSGTGAR